MYEEMLNDAPPGIDFVVRTFQSSKVGMLQNILDDFCERFSL